VWIIRPSITNTYSLKSQLQTAELSVVFWGFLPLAAIACQLKDAPELKHCQILALNTAWCPISHSISNGWLWPSIACQ
jgi:hypothetical protein